MRAPREKVVEDWIVAVFDIRSSSEILEDLTLTDHVDSMTNTLRGLKEFLRYKQRTLPFRLYKFTGDGWILLFGPEVCGKALIGFLKDLNRKFHELYREHLDKMLEKPPANVGLKFGVARGKLVKFIMASRREYIGRAINVAHRLQEAADQDYPVLISWQTFPDFKESLGEYGPIVAKICLKNIQGGKELRCVKLSLPSDTRDDSVRVQIQGRRFRLFYRPPNHSKEMTFEASGAIGIGRNNNEHTWNVQSENILIFNSEGKLFSRFVRDPASERFVSNNGKDTVIKGEQYFTPV